MVGNGFPRGKNWAFLKTYFGWELSQSWSKRRLPGTGSHLSRDLGTPFEKRGHWGLTTPTKAPQGFKRVWILIFMWAGPNRRSFGVSGEPWRAGDGAPAASLRPQGRVRSRAGPTHRGSEPSPCDKRRAAPSIIFSGRRRPPNIEL